MHLGRVVADHGLHHLLGNARLVQEGRRGAPERVKGKHTPLSVGRRGRCRPPRRLKRGRKPASARQITELVGKRGGAPVTREQCGGSWMYRGARIVAARDRLQMANQGRGKRENEKTARLLGRQPELTPLQVDVRPGKRGD